MSCLFQGLKKSHRRYYPISYASEENVFRDKCILLFHAKCFLRHTLLLDYHYFFIIFFDIAVSLIFTRHRHASGHTHFAFDTFVLILKAYLTFPETKTDARVSRQSVTQNLSGHIEDEKKTQKRQRQGNREK